MKKLLVLFLFTSVSCFGQLDSTLQKKRVFGINLSAASTTDREFSIDLYARKGQHFFSFGQKIFLSRYIGYNHLYGADLDYRYYIGKKSRHLKCFIPAHSDLLFFESKYQGSGPSNPPYNGNPYTYKSHGTSISLFTGFGLDLRLGQRIHLSIFPGFGFFFTKYTSSYDYPSDPSLNNERKSGFFDNPYWDLMIKGGIGFDLFRGKK